MEGRVSDLNFIERVTTDAVHRRLLFNKNNKNSSNSEHPVKQLDYYVCEECNCKISALNRFDDLRSHFNEVKHNTNHHCVYCSKPVYKYTFKKGSFIYHECQYD